MVLHSCAGLVVLARVLHVLDLVDQLFSVKSALRHVGALLATSVCWAKMRCSYCRMVSLPSLAVRREICIIFLCLHGLCQPLCWQV
jgi:hypothetical protein